MDILEAYRLGVWENTWSRPWTDDDVCTGCPYLIQRWYPGRTCHGVSLFTVESDCCHPAQLVTHGCAQYNGSKAVGFARPNRPVRHDWFCPSSAKPRVGENHTSELVAACHAVNRRWRECVFAEDGPVELTCAE